MIRFIIIALFIMCGCGVTVMKDNNQSYPVDHFGAICTTDEQCGRGLMCDKRGNTYGKCAYFYDTYKMGM